MKSLTMCTDIPGPALLSSVTQNNSAKGPVSTPTPPPNSSFSQFTSLVGSSPASQSTTPQPPPSARSAFSPPPPKAVAEDPFAVLGSLSSPKPATPAPAPVAANDDDEWSFSSALPPEAPPTLPREHRAVVSNTSVKIDLVANRAGGMAPSLSLLFSFTNNTVQPVSELHFQLAVTKVSTLICLPPSTEVVLTLPRATSYSYNHRQVGAWRPNRAMA